jgi:hypothetical protein
MNALFTDENGVRQPALSLRRNHTRTGVEPITLPVPSWTGLNAIAIGLLVVVILVLYLWLAYFTWKMFLVDLAEAPELEVWNKETSRDRGNIVVIGAPKTGRRQAITALPDTQMISFAELATKDSWDRVILTHHRVGLYYFEFDLDNPETNDKKLKLLERLLYVEGKRVILVSAVDPMYYLACSVASASADAASGSAAVERLERWAAIFSKLQKVGLPIDSPHPFQHPRLRGRDDRQSKDAFDVLQEECETQGALHEFGCRILPPVESTSSASVERDKIIAQLLDQADPYYRLLWGTCTADERLVLFQLAYDGWANPKNTKAIQHLLRRGLVVRRRMAKAPGDARRVARPVGLRIMNESFRTFVLRSQHPLEMERWEREGRESLWRALRLSFLVAGFLGAVWIVQVYPSVSTVFVGSLGIVISVLSGVAKFFSDMRSPAVVATAVKPGA